MIKAIKYFIYLLMFMRIKFKKLQDDRERRLGGVFFTLRLRLLPLPRLLRLLRPRRRYRLSSSSFCHRRRPCWRLAPPRHVQPPTSSSEVTCSRRISGTRNRLQPYRWPTETFPSASCCKLSRRELPISSSKPQKFSGPSSST